MNNAEFVKKKNHKKFFIIPGALILSIIGLELNVGAFLGAPIWIGNIINNCFIFCFWISLGSIVNYLIDRFIFNKIFGIETPGQPRQRKLITQLVHFSILSIGFGLAMKQILSPELGTMVAGSGVIAIVLGLALQSTLSDLFAGVALNIERPYKAGEWITLEDKTEGLVLATNWRATHIKTRTNDIVIIPNSTIAKDRLINRTRPDLRHVTSAYIKLRPGFSLEIAKNEINNVLANIPGVLMTPTPLITIDAYSDFTCTIKIYFLIEHYAELLQIQCALGGLMYEKFNAHIELNKYWSQCNFNAHST